MAGTVVAWLLHRAQGQLNVAQHSCGQVEPCPMQGGAGACTGRALSQHSGMACMSIMIMRPWYGTE